MLEILYYIFIFPVEQVLEWALFTLFKATKNYGASIILLSLIMQLFMLKLTFYFDKKAASFGALKAQCDSKIKEFKRVFKGAELQSYIRTLYKQKHFHPIFALFGLGGLALQIPFFIAMIHLVENAEYLQSVRFLWIDDLSKPDSIMLFGLSIHILPLLMTAFTLINVFYSSKELGARVQGSLIALLFLVLLYSMPSALVLYWTCNMFFSLLKEIFKHKKHSSLSNHSQDCVSLEAVITTKVTPAPKSTQNSQSNTAITRMRESADRVGVECRDSNDLNLSQDARIAESRMESKITSSKQNSKNTESKTSKSKLQVLFFNIFTPHATIDSKTYKTYRNISILAILNICFIICVFSPYAIYSSDVSQFDISQTYQTLGALFGFFILSSFGLIYFTSFFYKTRLLKLGAWGVSVILCIGLVYTFVLDYNVVTGESYSQLDNFVFKNPHNLSAPLAKYVDLLVGILACVMILICLRKQSLFKNTLICLLIAFGAVSTLNAAHIATQKMDLSYRNIPISQEADSHLRDLLPPFHHDLTSFSKDKENVLILLFDAFTGSHLQIIFEQFPELKQEFQGFTYYPNTLSLDGDTIRTAHTILTGHNLSAFANRNLSMQTYTDNITDSLLATYQTFRKYGFKVDSFAMPHINSSHTQENIDIYDGWDNYFAAYSKMMDFDSTLQNLKKHNQPVGEMASMGLFYFAPYIFRTRIYKDFEFGNYSWIFGKKQQIGSFINGVKHTSALPLIVRNLNVDSTSKTFKYIHTMHTHYPFALNKDCMPEMDTQSQLPQQYRAFFLNIHHYDNEVCAMKETKILLDFLKDNGIYDNTMIVLVSDHSYNDLPTHNMPNQASFGNNPNPLLMIKKLKSNGDLKTDMRLMSNADVYGILCDEVMGGGGGCNVSNILKNYPQERQIIHTRNIHWTSEAQRADHLMFEKIWLIKDSVLDPKNFTDITESVKNGTFKIDGIEH
ncbi:YidC/Oxa1 family membrane protein insertase [Helicobacter cinaedi]|uniref:YidC/Oxa1 family membrane protein insertase n=7 Tax=Helicobacter cinaedi TaxID=213 RepID=UPI0018A597B0|nr:YidC/Oxa1 family membrane protein insertase [Helicobacter cinaedi]QOQ95973.1 YidC/Oxa1 family membrane protein insertase [Helicobacter cinaedi]